MIRSFKTFFIFMLLGGAVSVGFFGGRQLRQADARFQESAGRRHPYMLSAAGEGGVGGAEAPGGQDNAVSPSDIFETILDYVQQDYVEGIAPEVHLSHGALSALFASLDDPKTSFLEPALRQAQEEALLGRFQGIGAVLTVTKSKKADVEYRHLTIVSTMPNSPAEKAGLKPGDRITEIGGHWIIAYSIAVDAERIIKSKEDIAAKREEAKQVSEKFKKGVSLSKASTQLTTGNGKPIQLTVERAGKPLKMEMTTALTEVNPVEFRTLSNKVGYLRVRQFNTKATEAFQQALNKAPPSLHGLIVDLRGNPGGMRADNRSGVNGYDSALKLLGRLTQGGTVATIERKANKREPLTVTAATPSFKLPIVVLVDSGTANLSELVASALRDTVKAKIIGAKTFGDSILQFFTVLKDGSGIEMATARLFNSAGVDLAQGITPDIVVAEATGNADTALERAVAALGAGA